MRRRNLVTARGVVDTLPSAEEVVLRPELCKTVLGQVAGHVDPMGIEHVVVVGITTTGGIRLFHTYGKDLTLPKVAGMLEDLAKQARKAPRKAP